MEKIILHIDFDSFFASVEQQYRPLLRGKPLGVTATNGRTCIIAASREAKRLGIKTRTRTYDALRICPSITLVPADFVKYWEVSKKFLAICKDYSPSVEVFSIDEVFMDITLTHHLFGGVFKVVERMKKRIREEVGEYITVSVGVSHNKLLAKLASGLRKPDGLVVVGKNDIQAIYASAKLTDICGIGERVQARLHTMGIYTLLQLQRVPLHSLIAEFGKVEGMFLRNVGLGVDDTPLIPYTEAPTVKSVGRNYCLPHNEYDHRIVLQNVYELCEEVGIKLRRLQKKARTAGISLRGDYDIRGRKTFTTYFDTGKELFQASLYLIQNNLQGYVRQISVWASNLEDRKNIPDDLFHTKEKQTKLMSAIDHINEKFGDHTIRNGFLLYADKLTTVPNGYLADKYERIKLASTSL